MVDMPVTEFLAVQLASSVLAVDEPCLKRTSSWFSLQPPDCGEDVVWLLRSIPPLEFILQLPADHPQAWLNGFASIDKWRESHYWLPDSEKFILDYTSWNTRHSGALEGQLDWTRLISDEWLSDGIIDEMMRDIKARVSEDQSLASSTIIRPFLFQFYITQLGLKLQECGAARIQWFKKFMARAGIDSPVDPAFPQIDEMDDIFTDDLAADVSAETYFVDRSFISINDILNSPSSSTSPSDTAPTTLALNDPSRHSLGEAITASDAPNCELPTVPDAKIPKRKCTIPVHQSSDEDGDSENEKERARSKRTKETKPHAKKTSVEERRQTLMDDPHTVKSPDGSLKGNEHEVYCRCTPSKVVKLESKKSYTLANWYSHQKSMRAHYEGETRYEAQDDHNKAE
ncbi:hypothetical protein B0H14DRAFT_3467898 [Mycena olivaceomarginata]|nr:hypothetical protein B0H14DRAFT_3467898 [Mycena olivaceomarginata]